MVVEAVSMMRFLKKILKKSRGTTSIEYIIIVFLIVGAIIVTAIVIGDGVKRRFDLVTSEIETVVRGGDS